MLSKPIPTKFEASDLERLNYLAKLDDRPVSYLMREATRAYLDSQAKKLIFQEEAKIAAANYQTTGQHAIHEEVQSWLKDLVSGQISQKPRCHK